LSSPTPTYEELLKRLEYYKKLQVVKRWERNQTKIRNQRRKIKRLEEENVFLQSGRIANVPIKIQRKRYQGKRDPKTGRTIITCIVCQKIAPNYGHKMCQRCHMRWYRNQKLARRGMAEKIGMIEEWRLPGA